MENEKNAGMSTGIFGIESEDGVMNRNFKKILDKSRDGLSYADFNELIGFYDSDMFKELERAIWGRFPQLFHMNFTYEWNNVGMEQ